VLQVYPEKRRAPSRGGQRGGFVRVWPNAGPWAQQKGPPVAGLVEEPVLAPVAAQ